MSAKTGIEQAATGITEKRAPEYLMRFYRDGKMVHAQRDTLAIGAKLCKSGGCVAAIIYGDRNIGHMSADGRTDWYEFVPAE